MPVAEPLGSIEPRLKNAGLNWNVFSFQCSCDSVSHTTMSGSTLDDDHHHDWWLTGACYDITTVGVFTASSLRYKHGGLRRLKLQLNHCQSMPVTDNAAPLLAVGRTSSPWNRLAAVSQMLSKLSRLQSATLEACDSLCAVAAAGDPSALQAAATLLTEQVA